MRLFLAVLFTPMLLLAPAFTQTAPEPPRQVRFLAWESIDGQLHLGSGPKAVPLLLSTTELSPIIDLPPGVDRLVRRTVDATGAPVERPYARFPAWPADQSRAVALVVPGARQGELPARIILLPDSLAAHPRHSARILNFTRVPLALRAGSAQGMLEPGGELVAPYDPAAARFRLDLAAQSEGSWRRVFARNLPAPADHRLILLLRAPVNEEPGAESGQPHLVIVTDRTASTTGPRAPLPRADSPDAP